MLCFIIQRLFLFSSLLFVSIAASKITPFFLCQLTSSHNFSDTNSKSKSAGTKMVMSSSLTFKITILTNSKFVDNCLYSAVLR